MDTPGPGGVGLFVVETGRRGVVTDTTGPPGVVTDTPGPIGPFVVETGRWGVVTDTIGPAGVVTDTSGPAGVVTTAGPVGMVVDTGGPGLRVEETMGPVMPPGVVDSYGVSVPSVVTVINGGVGKGVVASSIKGGVGRRVVNVTTDGVGRVSISDTSGGVGRSVTVAGVVDTKGVDKSPPGAVAPASVDEELESVVVEPSVEPSVTPGAAVVNTGGASGNNVVKIGGATGRSWRAATVGRQLRVMASNTSPVPQLVPMDL